LPAITIKYLAKFGDTDYILLIGEFCLLGARCEGVI